MKGRRCILGLSPGHAFLLSCLWTLLPSASFAEPPIVASPANADASAREVEPDWRDGRPRFFASGVFDAGFLYLRPRLSAGYGKPHVSWAGVDANPILVGEGAGAYAGLRGALPWVDLRLGARYFNTFHRSLLCPSDDEAQPPRCDVSAGDGVFTRDDIESRIGPHSSYLTWEGELSWQLPAGPGAVVGEFALSYVSGVETNYFVFEETLKVVVDPPWIARTRAGYMLRFGPLDAMRASLVGEHVHLPRRPSGVWRAGFIGRIRLGHHLEARASIILTLASPDALGADGADTYLLGVRYRWATR